MCDLKLQTPADVRYWTGNHLIAACPYTENAHRIIANET